MKRGVMFFLGVLFFSSLALADTVDSTITNITLFNDQAQVSRKLSTKVEQGLNEIRFELKEYTVDPDSVAAEVLGDGEIYSVQLKTVYKKDEPKQNVVDLQKKLQDLQNQEQALKHKKQLLTKKDDFLKSVIDFSKAEIPKKVKTEFPSVEELTSTMVFLDEQYTSIFTKREKLNIELRELQKEKLRIENELKQIQHPAQKAIKVIEVIFNSDKKQSIDVNAKYITYNASWNPLYKIDISDDLKRTSMTMFAKIRQKTGEDWSGVKLSLSNAVPLKGARLPEAYSWHLDLARPAPMLMREMNSKSLGGLRQAPAMYAADMSAEAGYAAAPQKARMAVAQRKQTLLSFEYDLPQSLSIESKDKETVLPVLVKEITGDIYDYAVPKENQKTFLVCAASADQEILSGNVNVYLGGRFVGKTHIEEKRPGEKFYVNLGVDRGVVIKREKIKDKRQETFFGKIERKTVIKELAYKITIENLKDETVEVHLLDVIPVSKTDKIEVKELKITPEPTNKDYQDREGLNRWVLKVNPGQSKDIDIEFTVTYPKDEPIVGI